MSYGNMRTRNSVFHFQVCWSSFSWAVTDKLFILATWSWSFQGGKAKLFRLFCVFSSDPAASLFTPVLLLQNFKLLSQPKLPVFKGYFDVINVSYCTTGCFDHRDPWLQPASTSRRQPCICSSTDEAFLSQLWFPTSTTVFHPFATASIFFRRAFLHSGPWKMPQLLQYPHDTAEWRGGTTETVTLLSSARLG